MDKLLDTFKQLWLPVAALVIGISGALVIAAILGEQPFQILGILLNGALGSATQGGYSLFYATPLIFTGLSVAWAFRAGLFNIGAEGQMAIGGLFMGVTGLLLPNLPAVVALPLSLAVGFVTGGLWGALAGWMKAKRGTHEVLVTIMLNFIAFGLVSFFILTVFKNPDSMVPETSPVGDGYRLASLGFLGGQSPLNAGLFVALLVAVIWALALQKTKFGFQQRLIGGNAEVARRAGLKIDRHMIWAMFISGGLAGIAGASAILGYAHKVREGFTAGAGFVGIAVALLGRNSALGVIAAAVLFGVLHKGSLDLDIDTERITRDLSLIIQALVIVMVASDRGLRSWLTSLKERLWKTS